jgi:hypothetical protein
MSDSWRSCDVVPRRTPDRKPNPNWYGTAALQQSLLLRFDELGCRREELVEQVVLPLPRDLEVRRRQAVTDEVQPVEHPLRPEVVD